MPIPKVEKPAQKPFAEHHRERIAEVQPTVSGQAPFQENPQENIAALAADVYKKEPEKIDRYRGKIQRSLENHLAEDKSIDDLWGWLKKQNCTVTAIIKGLLRFFGETTDEEGKKVEKELNIAKFLKPVDIKAISAEGETMAALRTNEIQNTRNALEELLAEIQGGPSEKTSTSA